MLGPTWTKHQATAHAAEQQILRVFVDAGALGLGDDAPIVHALRGGQAVIDQLRRV